LEIGGNFWGHKSGGKLKGINFKGNVLTLKKKEIKGLKRREKVGWKGGPGGGQSRVGKGGFGGGVWGPKKKGSKK